ncbi:MAG: hypothetical protein AAGB26_18430, partial [Planctomycetota bacterium]
MTRWSSTSISPKRDELIFIVINLCSPVHPGYQTRQGHPVAGGGSNRRSFLRGFGRLLGLARAYL